MLAKKSRSMISMVAAAQITDSSVCAALNEARSHPRRSRRSLSKLKAARDEAAVTIAPENSNEMAKTHEAVTRTSPSPRSQEIGRSSVTNTPASKSTVSSGRCPTMSVLLARRTDSTATNEPAPITAVTYTYASVGKPPRGAVGVLSADPGCSPTPF